MKENLNTIRILHFVNVLDRGGTERFIFNNLSHLDRNKINFDFILTRNQKEAYDPQLQLYHCKKIVIEPCGGNKLIRYLSLYRKLHRYFNNCGYQIIHFESNPPGIMATASVLAARNSNIPIRILHSHGAGKEKKSFALIRPLITAGCRFINTHCCNYYMAPSMPAAEYAFGKKIAKSEKCKIIKNAIDVKKYLYSSSRRKYYRSKLNIDEETLILGSVGRLSEVKNQSFMIDIFAAYAETDKDAKLLLIGGEIENEKNVRKQLEDKVHRYGIEDKVIIFGDSDDVPGILNCFDVFLFTSKSEALGIAAIEAQVNGLSVIAASDGIPEDVDITGNVKWLKLSDSKEKWVRQIREVSKVRNHIDYEDRQILNADAEYTAKDLASCYMEYLERIKFDE